jgi:hypothetical protein
MLEDEFRSDTQGRRYADMLAKSGFDLVLAFFDDPDRQRRMIESELHHDRPAFAGVIREFEQHTGINAFFRSLSVKESVRSRQAIGLIVRIVMVRLGWRPSGKRGSLTGLSERFSRSERYVMTAASRSPEDLYFDSLSDIDVRF